MMRHSILEFPFISTSPKRAMLLLNEQMFQGIAFQDTPALVLTFIDKIDIRAPQAFPQFLRNPFRVD